MNTTPLTHDHWVTLSGRRIDKVGASPRLQRRIAEMSGWFWNALLNWDCHTVSEVYAAHAQFDYDPNAVVLSADEEESGRCALAHLEWNEYMILAVQLVDGVPDVLDEWRGWLPHELASVVGLRLVDHAVRFLERDQVQDAACVLMDVADACAYVSDLGRNRRRNTHNEFVATEVYVEKRFQDLEDKLARKATAKAAANAKHKKTRDLKRFAIELASEKTYKSKRSAAKAILPRVLAEAQRLNRPLSQDRAETTIYEWLLKGN